MTKVPTLPAFEAANTPRRVRRTDRHLRDHHQACSGFRLIGLLPSSFFLQTFPGERLRDDKRWQYGATPAGNANFAWVQHIVQHGAGSGTSGTRITRCLGVA